MLAQAVDNVETASTLLDFVVIGAILMSVAQFLGSHAVDFLIKFPMFKDQEHKAAARLASNIVGGTLTAIAAISAIIEDTSVIENGRFVFLVAATYGILRALTESSYLSRSGSRIITGKEKTPHVEPEEALRQTLPFNDEDLVESLGDEDLRQLRAAMIAGHPIPGDAEELEPLFE